MKVGSFLAGGLHFECIFKCWQVEKVWGALRDYLRPTPLTSLPCQRHYVGFYVEGCARSRKECPRPLGSEAESGELCAFPALCRLPGHWPRAAAPFVHSRMPLKGPCLVHHQISPTCSLDGREAKKPRPHTHRNRVRKLGGSGAEAPQRGGDTLKLLPVASQLPYLMSLCCQ